MWRKTKLRAFTLLECLVALLVIAGSVQVYQGLTKILAGNIAQVNRQERSDWLLFAQQLERDLDGSQLVKVENGRLYIKKDYQTLAFGKSKSDDFRKTNADGRGYQPMIYGVKSSQISQNGDTVLISLTLNNGLERSFVYAFKKAS
ncbi:competence type IV pilus minor pilin ComGF [Streptococcus dentiloxodontae]